MEEVLDAMKEVLERTCQSRCCKRGRSRGVEKKFVRSEMLWEVSGRRIKSRYIKRCPVTTEVKEHKTVRAVVS